MSKNKNIDEMSDKKVLKAVFDLLQRARISHQFVANDEGLITHEVAIVSCGEKFFASKPTPLQHPLVLAPAQGTVN